MKTILFILVGVGWRGFQRSEARCQRSASGAGFSVAASDGKTVHLKDYMGKGNIILYFYPKDDTPGCTKEACGIRDTFSEFKGLDATVFGVSFDSVESHKAFIAKYKLPFVLLADTDKKVARAIRRGRRKQSGRQPHHVRHRQSREDCVREPESESRDARG